MNSNSRREEKTFVEQCLEKLPICFILFSTYQIIASRYGQIIEVCSSMARYYSYLTVRIFLYYLTKALPGGIVQYSLFKNVG